MNPLVKYYGNARNLNIDIPRATTRDEYNEPVFLVEERETGGCYMIIEESQHWDVEMNSECC